MKKFKLHLSVTLSKYKASVNHMLTKKRQLQFVTFVQSNLHTSQKREQLSASGRILTSEHLTATLTKDIQLLCYSSDSINSEIPFFQKQGKQSFKKKSTLLKM